MLASTADRPYDEAERLEELRTYELLDTPRESRFDRITEIASTYFKAPVALALVDATRLWIKSICGLELVELDRDLAPCRFTIRGRDVLIVEDTLRDSRFATSPFANEMGVRFYAGAPLITKSGYALGTLVVLDTQPRVFSSEDTAALAAFASIAIDEIEMRHAFGGESQESEQLRVLVTESPLAVFTIDVRGELLSWNPGAERLFGYRTIDAIGGPLPIVHPESRAAYDQLRARVAADETVTAYRLLGIRADGVTVDLSITASPTHNRRGVVAGMLAIVEDVTGRLLAERRDAHRSRVLELVAADASREEALAAIIAVVENSFAGAVPVVTSLLGDRLNVIASSARTGELLQPWFQHFAISDRDTPCARAVANRSVYVAHDVRLDETFTILQRAMTSEGIGSAWSSPIFHRSGRIMGTVCALFEQRREPTSDDIRLLNDAAHLSGIVIERYEDSQRLKYLALYDELTGLPNRVLFTQQLREAIAHCSGTLGVGMIDLDRFKSVNDTYGHRVGDDVLMRTASLLAGALRPGELLARRGGDEFLLLLPNVPDDAYLREAGQRLCDALRGELVVSGADVAIRASIGLAVSSTDDASVDAAIDRMLQEADIAMYEAKRRGDIAVVFTPELTAVKNHALEPMLARALHHDELVLHFQPQISNRTGVTLGAEALVRWNHPRLGLLQPAEFLTIAEDSGLIVPMGNSLLATACRTARGWHDRGHRIAIAVNVSPRQFESEHDLVDATREALRASGLPPQFLELEISERVALGGDERAAAILGRLKALGVRLAIDDFGTGYSNFAVLSSHHFDGLKIDKSFIDRIGAGQADEPRALAIIRAIVALSNALSLQTTVEGIETTAQRALLRDIDCSAMQGYLWAKPLADGDFVAWLGAEAR